MRRVIELAIEGGYRGRSVYQHPVTDRWCFNEDYRYSEVREDPLFWQALGKSLGWTDRHPKYDGTRQVTHEWNYHWHCFIEHCAEGKSPDEFFNSLINKE
jgi:hypothetical protein